jgi:hypothetical protein
MGLIWSLQGCPIVALTELTAAIKMPAGSQLTFYRAWRVFVEATAD